MMDKGNNEKSNSLKIMAKASGLNIDMFFRYPDNGRFHIFSASLWKCRLKIPRDARVNAFASPAIKSNENRWMTQGAMRSWYVFDTYPWRI